MLLLLGACNLTHVVFPCKSQMRVHSTGQTIARTSIADARGWHLAYGVGSPFASIAYYTIVQACSCVVPMQEHIARTVQIRLLLEPGPHGFACGVAAADVVHA